MGKSGYLLIGALVGAAAGVVVNYLFGPAQGTTFDKNYQSRLDAAIAEGERAADLRELELRQRFEQGKLPRPKLPETPASSVPDAGVPSGPVSNAISDLASDDVLIGDTDSARAA